MLSKILYIDISASVPGQHKQMADQLAHKFQSSNVAVFDFDYNVYEHKEGNRYGCGTNLAAVFDHAKQNPALEYHVVTDGLDVLGKMPQKGKWFWHLYPEGIMPPNVPGQTFFLEESIGKYRSIDAN